MEQATALAQANQLSALADRFTSLRQHLAAEATDPGTGTDALQRLTPLLTSTQELVTDAIARLTVLDDSPTTQRPGARAATACRYTVSWLHPAAPAGAEAHSAVHATAHGPQAKPVKLTQVQRQALQLISQGGVQLRESTRGRMYASVPGGLRINMATYNALHTKGLLHRDTGTSLYSGQPLTTTEHGHAALADRPTPTAGPDATRKAAAPSRAAPPGPLRASGGPSRA